jgi:Ca-activated chloride channel homolog
VTLRYPAKLFVVSTAILAAAVALEAQRRFRSSIDLTTVTATVLDTSGHLVTGLSQSAFEIYEDGERQTITQFTGERVPVSLAVLLDVSDSMFGQRIADAREAIQRFIPELLAQGDEYALMTFNHQQRLAQSWTSDERFIASALGPVRPWGSTAIYDAIAAALPLSGSRDKPRMALVVISDGADTASDLTIRETRAALLPTDVFVYAVAIDPKDRRPINAAVNPQALAEITDPSGGRTKVVVSSGELGAALHDIAEELNSQYLLGYTSPRALDGKFHSIRVRVPGTDYRIRARNGYVAVRSGN